MSPFVSLILFIVFGYSTTFPIDPDTCSKRYRTCLFSSIITADLANMGPRNLFGLELANYLYFYCREAVPKYIMCAECGPTMERPSAMCLNGKPVESFYKAVLPLYFTDVKCVRFWMNYHEHCLVPLYEPPEKISVLTAIVRCYTFHRADFDNCGENGYIAMMMRATHLAPMSSTLDVDLSVVTQGNDRLN
ncbi:uncharacterized protein LOC115221821 [Argonauta hians]